MHSCNMRKLVGVILLFACADVPIGESADASRRGPILQPLDSVTLAETPEVFVSRANDLELGSDGSLYVSDVALGQVLHFSPDGQLRRALGSKGDGPGEFRSPGWMTIIGDSLLAVRDASHRRVEIFLVGTGEWLGGVPLPMRSSTGLAESDGSLLVGGIDVAGRSSFQRIEIASATRDTSATTEGRHFGAVPADVHGSPLLADAFRLTNLAGSGGRVAQFFEVSNWMQLTDVRTGKVDSIHWSLARRKGAPVGLLPRIPNDQALGMRAVQHVSQPIEVSWRDENHVTVVSVDPDRSVNRYKGVTFVSVLDVSRRRACVDAMVSVSADPPPAAAVRADTLVVLHQTSSSAGEPATRISRYLISLDECDWIPGA